MIKNEDVKVLGGGATQLMVEHYSDETRILQIRGFTREATIYADMTTSSDRSLVTTIFDIDSIPIMLTARASMRGVKRGQLYIKVSLLVDGVVVGLLMAGYVAETHKVAYPGSDFEGSMDGRGVIKTYEGVQPAAGTEISYTIPAGVSWRILNIFISLTTSATVASRTPVFKFEYNGLEVFRESAATAHNASLTFGYTFGENSPRVGAQIYSANLYLPPDQRYQPDTIFYTQTNLIQAGDQYLAPTFLVEEWINP